MSNTNNGFPFAIKRAEHNPYEAMSEEKMLDKLEKSRKSAMQRDYKSVESVIEVIKGKYGL